ncbi:TPA: NUDIX domain-containing protein [Candidatus Poribacteria bacterium]|jgi:colanic acid biosynthesis protein WcaH|nr:NUDIX domain-containing protein [Candidatus Poribacteria bacterium]HIA64944.1 NUDIX domain-containing protein [Candidatus Poribacteria bacterium]
MQKLVLDQDEYFQAVSLTQLVSIDILVIYDGKLLVGERTNNPAKGSFFVPGGKVYKNEYLKEALERISKDEIGLRLTSDQITLHGIYDHIYENNFRDDSCGTHYVCIACLFELDDVGKVGVVETAMLSQHQRVEWLDTNQIVDHPKVHTNVKSYFDNTPTNAFP